MRWISTLVLIALFFLLIPASTFAQSNYVLPYPSSMPGSTFYKIRLVFEEINKYWHFGNLAQFTYNLKQSDKYLVESKTLFEYKQYLLAYNSLEKSTDFFKKAEEYLLQAKKEEKEISEKETLFRGSAKKHIEVLQNLIKETPQEFLWDPETGEKSTLRIHELLKTSILLREKIL